MSPVLQFSLLLGVFQAHDNLILFVTVFIDLVKADMEHLENQRLLIFFSELIKYFKLF